MRTASATLKAALAGGDFDATWTADVFLDGNRLLKDLPLLSPSFDDDGSSLVQGTGSVSVVYQDDFANSIAPKAVGDALSPFGSQLWVYVTITVGDGFVERIPMGHYLICAVPTIDTTTFLFRDVLVSKGDQIDLQLKDLFYGVQRDRFSVPSTPPSLTSVWAEFQRLTQLPVTRTISDSAITAAVAYQDDKLQACYDLATVLDGVACMLSDGTASMRPNVWPAVVDTIRWGDSGTLLSAGRSMVNDAVYNQVVVRTNGSDGTVVLATAQVTSGPLRVANPDGSLSPYRRVPYFYSSDFITTQAQAQAYADQQLPRVSSMASVTRDLTETFNPLREVGDVLTVVRQSETFTCRVAKVHRETWQSPQALTVQVLA